MRLGRATSSPPQLGQVAPMASAHGTQNVHSKLQIRASPASARPASHFSQVARISSMGGPYRRPDPPGS
jgi:hypothetical protein